MKKSLLAIFSLGCVAINNVACADTIIKASDNPAFPEFVSASGDITLVMDKDLIISAYCPNLEKITNIIYEGSYTFSLPPFTPNSVLNITGNNATLANWGTQLLTSSSDITRIRLGNIVTIENGLTFAGATVGGTVSLGDTEAVYAGGIKVNGDITQADYLVADGNKVALVNFTEEGFSNQILYLIGKGADTPPVPEPATGSLSLLALAGLCARRRKK